MVTSSWGSDSSSQRGAARTGAGRRRTGESGRSGAGAGEERQQRVAWCRVSGRLARARRTRGQRREWWAGERGAGRRGQRAVESRSRDRSGAVLLAAGWGERWRGAARHCAPSTGAALAALQRQKQGKQFARALADRCPNRRSLFNGGNEWPARRARRCPSAAAARPLASASAAQHDAPVLSGEWSQGPNFPRANLPARGVVTATDQAAARTRLAFPSRLAVVCTPPHTAALFPQKHMSTELPSAFRAAAANSFHTACTHIRPLSRAMAPPPGYQAQGPRPWPVSNRAAM